MIRWRNLFFALFMSAWAHGLAAAVLHTVGLGNIGTFCAAVAILSVIALVPVGCEVSEQADGFLRKRAEAAEEEVRRLRAELVEHSSKEEG